jgi:hypothetical protein
MESPARCCSEWNPFCQGRAQRLSELGHAAISGQKRARPRLGVRSQLRKQLLFPLEIDLSKSSSALELLPVPDMFLLTSNDPMEALPALNLRDFGERRDDGSLAPAFRCIAEVFDDPKAEHGGSTGLWHRDSRGCTVGSGMGSITNCVAKSYLYGAEGQEPEHQSTNFVRRSPQVDSGSSLKHAGARATNTEPAVRNLVTLLAERLPAPLVRLGKRIMGSSHRERRF